jgi:peroxiredoxin
MKAKIIYLSALSLVLVMWNPQLVYSINSPRELVGSDVADQSSIHALIRDSSKGWVIVFLSARCPCSASHEQRLKDLYSEFAPFGFRFLGIHSNADESVEMTRRHFSESHLPFSVLQDDGTRIADRFGAFKTPHVFVLNPQGHILFQGGVDDSHFAQTAHRQYLKEALTAIAAGRSPPQREVRALGCIIKRP